jgi:hypothetical protein
MFSAHIEVLRKELEEVRHVIEWQDRLRTTCHTQDNALSLDATTLAVLRSSAPSKLSWQIFDHCAAISRIYALFEFSIEGLIDLYLANLNKVGVQYLSLPERLRTQHRVGVGQILSKWAPSHPIYGSLVEKDISSGLADGLRGKNFSIQVEAFKLDPENYRVAAVNRFFQQINIANSFAWVTKDPVIIDFTKNRLSSQDTPDSFLNYLIEIRNDAAHGKPTSILSSSQLLRYIDFICLSR